MDSEEYVTKTHILAIHVYIEEIKLLKNHSPILLYPLSNNSSNKSFSKSFRLNAQNLDFI